MQAGAKEMRDQPKRDDRRSAPSTRASSLLLCLAKCKYDQGLRIQARTSWKGSSSLIEEHLQLSGLIQYAGVEQLVHRRFLRHRAEPRGVFQGVEEIAADHWVRAFCS